VKPLLAAEAVMCSVMGGGSTSAPWLVHVQMFLGQKPKLHA
jgi:hypothetical protein